METCHCVLSQLKNNNNNKRFFKENLPLIYSVVNILYTEENHMQGSIVKYHSLSKDMHRVIHSM